MRISRTALALFLSLILFASVATAQQNGQCTPPTSVEPGESLAGPWWFKLGGKDKGALLVQFSEPEAGGFTVTDVELTGNPSFGFSRLLGGFFEIEDGTPQLVLDSKGNLTGELEFVGEASGTLILEKGKPNKTFTKLKLRGTLTCDTCKTPVVVKLIGRRPPTAFPVLTGRTIAGKIKGKNLKGTALDMSVTGSDFGLPAYAWQAAGSVEDEGDEDPDFSIAGDVMLDPSFKAFGVSDDGDYSQGKLSVADPNAPIPKLGLVLQSDPKLKVKGKLTEATAPVLSVAPLSRSFGAARLDDANAPTQTFAVTNIGIGPLSGSAEFLSDAPDFTLDGDVDYELNPGDPPALIDVTFNPLTAGAKCEFVRFGVDSAAGSVVASLTGSGGIAEISVGPNSLEFDDTVINPTSPQTLTVTVTNTGDIPLVGQVSLSTTTAFDLMDGPVPAVLPIGYDLDPDEDQDITVRFQPEAAGAPLTATLTFTGATDLTTGANTATRTVSVSGTATTTIP